MSQKSITSFFKKAKTEKRKSDAPHDSEPLAKKAEKSAKPEENAKENVSLSPKQMEMVKLFPGIQVDKI